MLRKPEGKEEPRQAPPRQTEPSQKDADFVPEEDDSDEEMAYDGDDSQRSDEDLEEGNED